jgi:hypothetical protein
MATAKWLVDPVHRKEVEFSGLGLTSATSSWTVVTGFDHHQQVLHQRNQRDRPSVL